MARTVEEYSVFIASPGDVEKERIIVRDVCDELNRNILVRKDGIQFNPIGWEDVFPSAGRPQDTINRLVEECDIFVCIFHKKFGSHTGKEESGTLEEFLLAYDSWKNVKKPHILFYFKDVQINSLDDLKNEQLEKVLKLKKKITDEKILLYGTFPDSDSFRDQYKGHMKGWIAKKTTEQVKSKKPAAPIVVETPEAYFEWLCENYAHLDAEKLQGKGQAIPLSLPEIFIPLYAYDAEDKKNKKHTPEEKQAPVDIETLITKNDSLLIEGHAGSGKTTILKHLTYCLATREKNNPATKGMEDFLPVLILLKDLNDYFNHPGKNRKESIHAKEILTWYFKSKMNRIIRFETIEQYISSKKAVFLLDGLDELLPEYRDKVVDAFADLRIKNRGIKLVFAGRPHGITGAALKRFDKNHVTILALDMEQVKAFIQKWFKYLYPKNSKTGRKTADTMIGEIKDHPSVGALIDNPLMLTAVCILYHDEKELPGQRAELYKKFIDNLLYRRFADSEMVHEFLGTLAFQMHIKKLRGVDKGFAIEVLKRVYEKKAAEKEKDYKNRVEKIFEDIEPKCGLLKFENDQYNFWHLTFQEFLAADHIKDNHSDHLKAIENYWDDGWYKEMIELYIGYLSIDYKKISNDIVKSIIEKEDKMPFRQWRIASHALLDFHQNRRISSVVEKSKNRMLEILVRPSDPEILMDAGEILGWLGDTRDLQKFVKIEGGEYDLEDFGKVNIRPFEISQYPVTNGWYEKFIQAKGYDNIEYWSPEGQEWLDYTKAKVPRFWNDRKWKCPNAPVVGVCWYEADAFTKWLPSDLNDGFRYRLLAEKEWQAAAAGKNRRKYPWNGEWDKNNCNNREIKIEKISPTGIFKKGNTPEGVADLSGNVWEWTLSDYHSKKDLNDFTFDAELQKLWDEGKYGEYSSRIDEKKWKMPVLRGGSWINGSLNCRCAIRSRGGPSDWDINIGFRCART